MSEHAYKNINRFEVLDFTASAKDGEVRALIKWIDTKFDVTFMVQDDERTLKVVLKDRVE